VGSDQRGQRFDLAVALVLTLGAVVPGVAAQGLQLGELPVRQADALGVGLVLAQALPLVLSRRRPAVCLVLVGAAFAWHQAAGYPTTFASLGLLLALFAAGAFLVRGRRPVATAAAAAYVALAVVLHGRGSPESASEFASFGVVLLACWAAGAWYRARRLQAHEEHLRRAADAAADERGRIARELHDVVTHHVTAMVAQADAARFTMRDAASPLPEALEGIAAAGRLALTELRHQLGVLGADRSEDARDLESADIESLVRRLADGGQPVGLVRTGEPRPATSAARLAAYRVVQESLTNAMKHAPGRRTEVRVDHGDQAVEVHVRTDPGGGTPAAGRPVHPAGSGRGLDGLRERVGLLGGELRAGRGDDGSFDVVARIPNGTTR
jgi:signal transduction histidine kinase